MDPGWNPVVHHRVLSCVCKRYRLYLLLSLSNNKEWFTVSKSFCRSIISCQIRSDSQTTGLSMTAGELWGYTKRRCAIIMNIHYDVTSLRTAVWKVTLMSTCLGCLSWQGRRWGGGGRILIAHIRDIQKSVCSRQLDR